jgi:phosphoglycerol transferase
MTDYNEYYKIVTAYIFAIILSLFILIWVMELWRADLSIPFYQDWDANFFQMAIKGMMDNGWYQSNVFLGAPEGQYLYDFPFASNLDMILIKLISLFISAYPLTLNIYLLITFPLITITSMICFRQFKIPYSLSIMGGVLYAFMPYHFLRIGASHLNLVGYYIIPLAILVILWINEGKSLIFSRIDGKITLDLINRKSLTCIIICILVSTSYIYYSFFTCFLLLISGLVLFLSHKDKLPLLISGAFIAIILIGVFLNNAPTLVYQQEYGKNPMAAVRSPSGSEYYGLKITKLLFPLGGHRIPLLADVSQRYGSTTLLPNSGSETLGGLGAIGFLALILWSFSRIASECGAKLSDREKDLNELGILNLSSLLLGTLGGFGSVFAYLVSPQIRDYSRISIFIAFFSIFALLILLNASADKYARSKRIRSIFMGLLVLFLIAGVMDQTTIYFVPPYNSTKAEFVSDDDFIKTIERMMPEGAMIFQLPYVPFPESPPVNKMIDYSHLKGYLHSEKLRWSYGAMKGRPMDAWQGMVAGMPVGDMLKTLSETGFEGIYIDSYGYQDGGSKLISDIMQILGVEPLISENKRLYFFDMTLYDEKIKADSSKKRKIAVAFNSDWYGIEDWSGVPTRWMQADATLFAFSPENRTANLSLQVLSFYLPRTLEIRTGDGLVSQVDVPVSLINVSTLIHLSKGANIMRFHVPEGCDSPNNIKELNNKDARCLSLAVQNLGLEA